MWTTTAELSRACGLRAAANGRLDHPLADPEHRERPTAVDRGADPLRQPLRGGRAVDELAQRVHRETVPAQAQPGAQQPPARPDAVLPRAPW